jgi:hypothetical protein
MRVRCSNVNGLLSDTPQLWSQLGLSAKQVLQDFETSTIASTKDKISIALSHKEYLNAPRSDCLHKICYHTPPADITPPSQVAVAELKVVKLEVDLSTNFCYPTSMKRKRDTLESASSIVRHGLVDDMNFSAGGEKT